MTVFLQSPLRRFVPALAAFALFAIFALLWMTGSTGAYRHALTIWGVRVFAFPFLDTETILSGARCLRAGVDVYVANPCDTLGRIYDYSPLWMAIARLPVTSAWGVPAGLAIDMLFLIALLLLPPGRTWRHAAAITIGAISTTAAFAVERGNNDLVLFALAALAATLACRSTAVRHVGYGCALLAGLLKYYPMVLMAMAARERLPRLAMIALATLSTVALCAALTWYDLTRALALVPTGSFFGDMFGARQVAGGLGALFALPESAAAAIRWTMSLAAIGAGITIARRRATLVALAALTLPERAFLLAGGLLTLGCFFTAQNISYRMIHLMLTLPALLALRQTGARTFHFAAPIALALLWADGWRRALAFATKGFDPEVRAWCDILGWALRESLWWWLIALLAACVIALLRRSTLFGYRPALWA